eukprot:4212292-Karenia_brevis.AAC.1
MIQGVDTSSGEWVDKPTVNVGNGIMKEACSIEMSIPKRWCIGAVTKQRAVDEVSKQRRQQINRFEILMDEDEEDKEDEEDVPVLIESSSKEEEDEEEDDVP